MKRRVKRPGHLAEYARYAGIAVEVAARKLTRIGLDYDKPFSFQEADRRLAEASDPKQDATRKQPLPEARGTNGRRYIMAEEVAKKEHYRAKKAQLDYEVRMKQLVEVAKVTKAAFSVARLVRDTLMNIPDRLAGVLASPEHPHAKVYELMTKEIRQALEGLSEQAVEEAVKGL